MVSPDAWYNVGVRRFLSGLPTNIRSIIYVVCLGNLLFRQQKNYFVELLLLPLIRFGCYRGWKMALFSSFSYEYAAYGGLFLLVWIVLYPLFFSWSRSIPGPVLARYTRFWYVWNVFNYKFHLANKKLHEKYGNIDIFSNLGNDFVLG